MSPRLRAVAAAVPRDAGSVADVGAGDGQLPRHLAALQPQERAGELAAWRAAAGLRKLASARPSERGRSYTVLVVTPPQ